MPVEYVDFPRPLGVAPPYFSDPKLAEEARRKYEGFILESRFTLYAESDAEAIAKLTGEIK